MAQEAVVAAAHGGAPMPAGPPETHLHHRSIRRHCRRRQHRATARREPMGKSCPSPASNATSVAYRIPMHVPTGTGVNTGNNKVWEVVADTYSHQTRMVPNHYERTDLGSVGLPNNMGTGGEGSGGAAVHLAICRYLANANGKYAGPQEQIPGAAVIKPSSRGHLRGHLADPLSR